MLDQMGRATRNGELDDYRQHAPVPIGMASFDEDACREMHCPECGRRGLDWFPFTSKTTGSYRAFAVCACGASVEI